MLPTPNDLTRMALEDAKTLSPEVRLLTRYVADPEASKESLKITSLVLNYVSRSSGIKRPDPTARGHLVRVYLPWYAPRQADLVEWIGFWEQLAFDPAFNLLITRDTIDLAGITAETLPKKTVTRTRMKKVPGKVQEQDAQGRKLVWAEGPNKGQPVMIDGEIEIEERVTEEVAAFSADSQVDVIRLDAQHLDRLAVGELQQLLGTQAPVVDHRYLKHRLMTTIKKVANQKTVYDSIYGGRYYEFVGIKKAKDVLGKDTKASDLDLFFENLGIGNIKAGVTAAKLFDQLRSDQRLVMFRSKITDKPREVEMFNVPAARETNALGMITGDIFDEDIDIGDRPQANLLNPRKKAREAIFPHQNGAMLFALFNENGELQDEVPFNIANDTTIPGAATKRLQAARGCIICHQIFGDDGWRPLQNDVQTLVRRLDIFADRSSKIAPGLVGGLNLTLDDLQRLVGLYSGDFTKNLRRNRDDVAEITLKATGPWPGGRGDQTDVAKLAALRLQAEMDGYWYASVTPQQALREMGFDVPAERSVKIFNELLPPDQRAKIPGTNITLEDPSIGALKEGIAVSRSEWALSYQFAMERSLRSPMRAKLIAEAEAKGKP